MATTSSKVYGSKYIFPLCDWSFKRLFGNDNVKDYLISLINSIYPQLNIVGIEYINTESIGYSVNDRNAAFDICCKLKSGEYVIIEMQSAQQSFIAERSIFYTSIKIHEQAPKGNWDYHIKAVYTIVFLNFTLPPELKSDSDNCIWKYVWAEETCHAKLSSKANIAMIELPNFKKSAKELTNITEKWLFLLRNLHSLTERPETLQDDSFNYFFELAEVLNMTPEELHNYENAMYHFNDYQNTLDFAEAKGEKKGIKEGIKEGIRQTVINGLRMGLDLQTIVSISGLSLEEVQSIQASLQ